MNKLTPERLEQLKFLRDLLDHIEAGGIVEVNRGWPEQPVWDSNGALAFLDRAPWFRIVRSKPKSAPRYYTVEELIKAGARYLGTCAAVYTILYMSAETNLLAIFCCQLETYDPCGSHQRNFKWSADGKEWKSFVKED